MAQNGYRGHAARTKAATGRPEALLASTLEVFYWSTFLSIAHMLTNLLPQWREFVIMLTIKRGMEPRLLAVWSTIVCTNHGANILGLVIGSTMASLDQTSYLAKCNCNIEKWKLCTKHETIYREDSRSRKSYHEARISMITALPHGAKASTLSSSLTRSPWLSLN